MNQSDQMKLLANLGRAAFARQYDYPHYRITTDSVLGVVNQ
jgi:hypothetical protein